MKKRISSRKKSIRSHVHAWHQKKHLRAHIFLVYLSASIFLFTLFAVVVHVFIRPIAYRNESFYDTKILGEAKAGEGDQFRQGITQVEDQQKTTEKEVSDLHGDSLYQKAVGRPTLAPDPTEVKIQDEDKQSELVKTVIATGVIDIVNEKSIISTVENDKSVYKIAGLKKFKFLGFIPVTQPVTTFVSSETGKVIKTEQPFFTSFVDFLSP